MQKKTLKLFKSKDSAGASGSIPFETHSSILSSLGCTKTTSPRFICERIRTFLFLPLLLLLLLLPRTGYNYPAVLKHTNLIEQRNQCGIVLLGLLFFLFLFFLEKKNLFNRHQHVDMMGPNMLERDAKCYQQRGMMTHLQLAGVCVCVWGGREREREKRADDCFQFYIPKKDKGSGGNSKTTQILQLQTDASN